MHLLVHQRRCVLLGPLLSLLEPLLAPLESLAVVALHCRRLPLVLRIPGGMPLRGFAQQPHLLVDDGLFDIRTIEQVLVRLQPQLPALEGLGMLIAVLVRLGVRHRPLRALLNNIDLDIRQGGVLSNSKLLGGLAQALFPAAEHFLLVVLDLRLAALCIRILRGHPCRALRDHVDLDVAEGALFLQRLEARGVPLLPPPQHVFDVRNRRAFADLLVEALGGGPLVALQEDANLHVAQSRLLP
mmetsp:Transcript_18910/g.54739  ORF Transcript_18910/g.54739 Transcript_18910/m.54739 type:complete len:242 (+) Transcript_18910:1266-1991(+)